jgi:hypothetical protein
VLVFSGSLFVLVSRTRPIEYPPSPQTPAA